MSNIPSYKGLGARQTTGSIITTVDNPLTWEDAMKPWIIMGGTNGSTFLLPNSGLEVGNWFQFHIVNDAVTAATRFGAQTSIVDSISADSTGRFVVNGSTAEGGCIITAFVISPTRYSFVKAGGSSVIATVVTT